ncbi:hypothetical protein ACA910_020123 [Epithemia clementina (nom. ined.)]
MFPLSDRLRTQRQVLAQEGALVLPGCIIKQKDAVELIGCVDESPTPLSRISLLKCKIDAREVGTLSLLQLIFDRPSLRKVVLDTPTLSNELVAEMLSGARDYIEELSFTWSFARAAALNRHKVFEQMHQLRSLTLTYHGLEYFSEMDSDFASAVRTMERLKNLELCGWTVRDVKLRELVDSIKCMPSLKRLHLERIRGLGPMSLPVFGELDAEQDDAIGLEELSLCRCKSIFDDASVEEITSFIGNLNVPRLVLEKCFFTRQLVRAILRAVGEPSLGTFSSLSLEESAFGRGEFELLLEILPTTKLTTLHFNQISVSLHDTLREMDSFHRFEAALTKNKTLTNFKFLNARGDDDIPSSVKKIIWGILRRNKRAHYVERALKSISIVDPVSPFLFTCAIARLLVDDEGTTDVHRLLTNRISVLTGST